MDVAPGRTLRVERQRETLRVVIDRPDRNNSINDTLMRDLHAALDEAEGDPTTRLVVIEGSGPVFCSGMDFGDAADSNRADDGLAARGGQVFYGLLKRLASLPRVVVSVVDGRVTGGGVGIAAASDFVYASARSSFALPEALWGLLPCCVLPFLIRRTGFQPAYAMTLSTLPVTAEHAARIHLVDEVMDDARPALRRLASRLTKIDTSVVADGKRYFEQLRQPAERHEQVAVTEFARLMSSPVVRGRIAGFAQNQLMPWENR
ncbi:enoyl-CoA hydratase-related protein [Streptomyces sp. NPDC052109]|uniref:enoyl-CoA hydratase-related protein n=1 Tax=Streptomyces sp. NPDC052109 TaxID=3155527 RepID=UPI00343832FA